MKSVIIRSLVYSLFIPVFILAYCTAAYATEAPYELQWVCQLGSRNPEESRSVSVDISGNVYICGYTAGNLGGPNAGANDVFIAKYDSAGIFLWIRQFGTSAWDNGYGITADTSGNIYITGTTGGNLGAPNAGAYDVFLAKYDSAGSRLWMRQLGASSWDWSYSVAVDALGNAYISGSTEHGLFSPTAGPTDAFLAKYDSAGTLLWGRQPGTGGADVSNSVALDAYGNAYISGCTSGSLGGPNAGSYDAFLAKYDGAGALLWTRQLGTSGWDESRSVAVDGSGNAYVSGYTNGSLGGPNAGSYDAFLAKYDPTGALLWTRQIGTSTDDRSLSVAVDDYGNAYVSGHTGGSQSSGLCDVFLAKYDSTGSFLWIQQLATSEDDISYSIAVDASANAYITGYTFGNLGGPQVGSRDAFLAKFSAPIPEAGTLALIAPAILGFAGIAFRRRTT